MRQQAERADFVRLRILPGDDQGAVGLALVSYVRQARTFARANVTVPSAQRLVSSSWIASGEDPVANPSTASGFLASTTRSRLRRQDAIRCPARVEVPPPTARRAPGRRTADRYNSRCVSTTAAPVATTQLGL